MIEHDLAKQAAGHAAAHYVQEGMLVGLGTGSTAEYFIQALIERHHKGLAFTAIASSMRSRQLVTAAGIPLLADDDITSIDLTVDGADEITPTMQLIKGGGGALLREKIVATASSQVIFIVDETKVVKQLGASPLPVEIVPFAYKATLHLIAQLGHQGTLRCTAPQKPYLTDNGNYIIDLHLKHLVTNPEQLNHSLRVIPGVVETGLFYDLPSKIIIGYNDGHTELIG